MAPVAPKRRGRSFASDAAEPLSVRRPAHGSHHRQAAGGDRPPAVLNSDGLCGSIRWVIAATSSIVIGNAAYDVAVSLHPQERVLLRQGIRVVRKHEPNREADDGYGPSR